VPIVLCFLLQKGLKNRWSKVALQSVVSPHKTFVFTICTNWLTNGFLSVSGKRSVGLGYPRKLYQPLRPVYLHFLEATAVIIKPLDLPFCGPHPSPKIIGTLNNDDSNAEDNVQQKIVLYFTFQFCSCIDLFRIFISHRTCLS